MKNKNTTEDAYVRLARLSLESYIRDRKRIYWDDVKEEILADTDTEKIDEKLSRDRAGAV